MEDVIDHIMNTPDKGLFFATATALMMVQKKYGLEVYEAKEADDLEGESLSKTIQKEMGRENQVKARRKLFSGR